MIEPVTKTINGNEYVITPFAGMHGWKLQTRLGKMIGPALKEVIGSLPKGKIANLMDSDIDPSVLGGGIAALIDAIASGDPQGEFVAELLSQTTRNGALLRAATINDVYAANYTEMFKAVIAVVGANGFFGLPADSTGFVSGLLDK